MSTMVSIETAQKISAILGDGSIVFGKVRYVGVSFADPQDHTILILPCGTEAVVFSQHLVIEIIDEVSIAFLTRIIFRRLDTKFLLLSMIEILQVLFHGEV